jgi:hypothetical protein
LEKDDYLSAKRILTLASKVATRMNRTDILRQIAAEQDDLSDKRKASVEVAEHALRLLQAPDDPNANLAFGKYLCFNKDDWQKGLVLLTRGNDSTLKVIAADELASQDSPTKQAEVANRWWELADSNPQYKNAIRWHAADLYTAAIERLDGLGRSLAEKRIGEMKNVPRKTANAAPRSLFPTGPES